VVTVANDKLELGFLEKLGTPAHIRIESDALTAGERGKVGNDNFNKWQAAARGYIDNFILSGVKSRREEKSHVFSSLNEYNTTFFFGSMPVVYSFNGVVYDLENQEWYNDFNYYYENYLKGTSSVRNRTRIFVVFADQIIEGFLLNLAIGKDAQTNGAASIAFDFLVSQEIAIGYTDPLTGNSRGLDKKSRPSASSKGQPQVAPEGTTLNQYKGMVQKALLNKLPFSNLNLPGMAANLLGGGSPMTALNSLFSEVASLAGAKNPLAGFANPPDPRLDETKAPDPLGFLSQIQQVAANPAVQLAGQFFPKIQPFTQALADPIKALEAQGLPASDIMKFYRAISTKKAADSRRA
jgi:hypothetical protein